MVKSVCANRLWLSWALMTADLGVFRKKKKKTVLRLLGVQIPEDSN